MCNLTDIEFKYHLKRAGHNVRSLNYIYERSLKIIKGFLIYKFGHKQYSELLTSVPHDVFTKVVIENPPEKFSSSAIAYLCTSAYNHVISMFRRKDNCTEKLVENISYYPDYENELQFTSREVETAWNELDEQSKQIIYLNVFIGWPLNELAELLNLRYDYVRLKKSRAFKKLREAVINCGEYSKYRNQCS